MPFAVYLVSCAVDLVDVENEPEMIVVDKYEEIFHEICLILDMFN